MSYEQLITDSVLASIQLADGDEERAVLEFLSSVCGDGFSRYRLFGRHMRVIADQSSGASTRFASLSDGGCDAKIYL